MRPPFFWGLAVPFVVRRLLPSALFESPIALAARHPWLTLAGLGIALAIGGFTVAATGIVPIKASSGHWPVTQWFLQFSKRQSVSFHALRIEVPPLDDPALVARGAGHYDLGCRPCHGSPERPLPPIPAALTGPPPRLEQRVREWRARELFYVVKHGIKFTGMPAWPALAREDEVWAVVAFLQRLPELDAAAYRQLAEGETRGLLDLSPASAGAAASPPEPVVDVCARCHGVDGRGRGIGAFPILAGQSAEYLVNALRAYAEGRRHSGIMQPVAAALTAGEADRIAAHYAAQAPAGGMRATDPAAVPRGASIARLGAPEADVPSCADCHGPGTAPRNPAYPRLAGQPATYLAGQLRLMKERHRGGSEYVHLMHSFVDRLTDGQILDAAAYYSSLQDE